MRTTIAPPVRHICRRACAALLICAHVISGEVGTTTAVEYFVIDVATSSYKWYLQAEAVTGVHVLIVVLVLSLVPYGAPLQRRLYARTPTICARRTRARMAPRASCRAIARPRTRAPALLTATARSVTRAQHLNGRSTLLHAP